MKKKFLLGLASVGMSAMLLAGCAEVPDGVDEEFHLDAITVFSEIDDDTMELEVSDFDDVTKLSFLATQAESKPEKEFIAAVQAMVELQRQMVENQDKNVLQEYLRQRTFAMELMNLDDNDDDDNTVSFTVPYFEIKGDF